MTCLIFVPCDVKQKDEAYKAIESWPPPYGAQHSVPWWDGVDGRSDPVAKLHDAYWGGASDLIGYIHSDVSIYEEYWMERILAEFDDHTVGVVGFGGALGLGHPDLYKVPYDWRHMARSDYRSNTTDADFHGERERGACDVATLDGFALFVRRSILDATEGWPYKHLFHHAYDHWLCLAAQRQGYRVRMVGIECQHHGGGTSVRGDWSTRCVEEFGLTDQQIHERAHEWLYDEFRDLLPLRVNR